MSVKTSPWRNYSQHRTTSNRKGAGAKSNKIPHGVSKRRFLRDVGAWWGPCTQPCCGAGQCCGNANH